MPPDLTEDDKAIIVELLRETIRARPLPAAAAGQAAARHPGEARDLLDAGDVLPGTKGPPEAAASSKKGGAVDHPINGAAFHSDQARTTLLFRVYFKIIQPKRLYTISLFLW